MLRAASEGKKGFCLVLNLAWLNFFKHKTHSINWKQHPGSHPMSQPLQLGLMNPQRCKEQREESRSVCSGQSTAGFKIPIYIKETSLSISITPELVAFPKVKACTTLLPLQHWQNWWWHTEAIAARAAPYSSPHCSESCTIHYFTSNLKLTARIPKGKWIPEVLFELLTSPLTVMSISVKTWVKAREAEGFMALYLSSNAYLSSTSYTKRYKNHLLFVYTFSIFCHLAHPCASLVRADVCQLPPHLPNLL